MRRTAAQLLCANYMLERTLERPPWRDSHESPGASPEPGALALQEGLSRWLVCLAACQFWGILHREESGLLLKRLLR